MKNSFLNNSDNFYSLEHDKETLFCRFRISEKAKQNLDVIKLIVLVLHGYGEHSEFYTWLLSEYKRNENVAFFTHDHYGHGKSSGPRNCIDNFKRYLNDVDFHINEITKIIKADKILLIGHSMGGLMACHYAIQYPQKVTSMILISPCFDIKMVGKRGIMQNLLFFISYFTKSAKTLLPLDPNTLTHNEDQVKRYVSDPLVYHDNISYRILAEISKSINYVVENADKINIPYYLVHGTKDEICPIEGSYKFHTKTESNTKIMKGCVELLVPATLADNSNRGCCTGTARLFGMSDPAKKNFDRIKLVVFILHGCNEHTEYYNWMMEQNDDSIAYFTHDHYGHGRSSGKKNYVSSFNRYIDDVKFHIDQIMNILKIDKILLVGHSMGGLIATHYVLKYPKNIIGMILIAPCFYISHVGKRSLMQYLVIAISNISKSARIPALADKTDISHDQEHVKKYRSDPFVFHATITFSLLAELCKAINYAMDNAHKINVPYYIVHGTKDNICPIEGSYRFHKLTNSINKNLKFKGHIMKFTDLS
ncbi:hypothetical protein A3Q56_01750 [Intoshia linei]|uniref:Serine aminopeptidase S33 domain-containing protein n=1 Tax=Intoshia linei TaxID=1819745 RepID=A0A177B8B6_9BILA|nr:hypothetical protein A3Q56_01750 [Intoshia linei]